MSIPDRTLIEMPSSPETRRFSVKIERLATSKPDEDVINALMHAVSAGTWRPNDQNRDLNGIPITTLEGAIYRVPKNFWPPRNLHEKRGENFNPRSYAMYRRFADFVVEEAMRRAIANGLLETIAANRKAISNVHQSYSAQDHQRNIYFSVNSKKSETGKDSSEAAEEIRDFVDEAREKIKVQLRGVMSDVEFLDQVVQTIEVLEMVDIKVVLRDAIARLNYIKSEVENPNDQAVFKWLLRQAVSILGCSDLEVELLTVEQALIHGARALYTPAGPKNGNKDTIWIPMSEYGSDKLLDLAEVFELLAHEVAHYQFERYIMEGDMADGVDPHNFTHSALSEMNLRKLRECKLQLTTGENKVVWATLIAPTSMDTSKPISDDMLNAPLAHGWKCLNPDNTWLVAGEAEEK